MGFVSVLGFTHHLLAQRVQFGDIAVDATLGNGVDALLLAKLVGRKGRLIGFDVQQQALDQTWMRLRKEFPDASSFVQLHLCSHAMMADQVPTADHGAIAAVTFNLGYLPGADVNGAVTHQASTLPALEASLKLLRRGGIMTIVLYTGHAGGAEEAEAVELWTRQLHADEYQVLRYQFTNQPQHRPYLLAIEKK